MSHEGLSEARNREVRRELAVSRTAVTCLLCLKTQVPDGELDGGTSSFPLGSTLLAQVATGKESVSGAVSPSPPAPKPNPEGEGQILSRQWSTSESSLADRHRGLMST